MSISQSNIQRIKNIAKGNITAKSKISIGYQKNNDDHIEGDIWEESGKQWTIKSGIKQTISKLDGARLSMPLICPKCGRLMKGRFDQKSYTNKGVCLDCMVEIDTKLIIAGKFDEYEKSSVNKNIKSFISDVKQLAIDYIDASTNNSYVTEQGDIENWSVGRTKEELTKIFNKQINEIEQTINT